MDIYKVFCVILGETTPFPVDISQDKTVGDLKDMIKAKKSPALNDIAADNLELYQVDIPDDDDLEENVIKWHPEGNKPLRATKKLAAIFEPSGPAEETIHVAVVLPPRAGHQAQGGVKRKASFATDGPTADADGPLRKRRARHSGTDDLVSSPFWCPRQDTVSGVFRLLHKCRIVQVRGTPASGKTTLMYLLHAYILKECPNAEVIISKHWPEAELRPMTGNDRLKERLPGYPSFADRERYFLFDEGQTTYWDKDLWLAFKDTIQSMHNPVYAILFCSYGNEDVRDPKVPTPLDLTGSRVTLERACRDGGISFGLLLDKSEFGDVIDRDPKLRLAGDLRDFIYDFTRGHVGATLAVAQFLLKKRENSMLTGHPYRLEDFYHDNPSYDEFCKHINMDRGIRRGLPTNPAEYAPAMRALLLYGSIGSGDKTINADIQSCLKDSYTCGFVNMDEDKLYTFASPLHQQLWSWHLLPQSDYQLPFQDLFAFVKETIAGFRPSQLDGSNRRVGSASHRPPEAQYQEEYYRCVHNLTHGNVRITPEYAAATRSRPGRIDFFIPSKKWGIELTRDGSRLNEHASRFADDGAYGQWLKSSDMDDYVLLDFRSTEPRDTHPGIKNLYHVVFNNDMTQVEIYNNKLDLQDKRNLMQRI